MRCKLCKRALALVLALTLPLGCLAEEDEEISIEDTAGIFLEEVTYDDVAWQFPIDLMALDPVLIRLANKQVLLGKDFVPSPLVTMKTRKANADGSNANGGVKKASSSEMKLQEELSLIHI